MNNILKELYISVDIEADGPFPGEYSMTALGATVAGYRTFDGTLVKFDSSDPKNRFYAEIKPISDNWDIEAIKVGIFKGLSKEEIIENTDGSIVRNYLFTNGEEPAEAMNRFADWVNEAVETHEAKAAVFAAFPLGFDWLFTYWYLMKFSNKPSPFGHSRHIDIKTLFSEKGSQPIARSIKRNMPKHVRSSLPHTHLAIDDAAEQGELLMNLLAWEGKTQTKPKQ